ncbi:UNVERIFIED_CONTAM: hypothetical protein Sradi_5693000 [Sesamum radiatum]|uniref:Reverse transcriptase n=1 Tax=Sesamum radiatum TaxID=300843 RepID=A0AAW2L3F7_SESRA
MKVERMEFSDDKVVELIPSNSNRTTRIGSQLPSDMEMMLIDFLRENVDMFTWTTSDFQGINPKIIEHKLNMDPNVKSIRQKRRNFSLKNASATYQRLVNPMFKEFIHNTVEVRSGKFLGYLVTQKGIKANPAKSEAILQMPTLNSMEDIQ